MDKQAKKKIRNPFVYGIANDQCVWSRAGVIKPMKCINAFDCLDCSFDRKLQSNFEAKQARAGKRKKAHITPRMQMLSGQLKCRHMLSGRVDYKMCAHNYNCVKCPYDKMIDPRDVRGPLVDGFTMEEELEIDGLPDVPFTGAVWRQE